MRSFSICNWACRASPSGSKFNPVWCCVKKLQLLSPCDPLSPSLLQGLNPFPVGLRNIPASQDDRRLPRTISIEQKEAHKGGQQGEGTEWRQVHFNDCVCIFSVQSLRNTVNNFETLACLLRRDLFPLCLHSFFFRFWHTFTVGFDRFLCGYMSVCGQLLVFPLRECVGPLPFFVTDSCAIQRRLKLFFFSTL